MISYSRPKLSDFYTLSQTKLLKNPLHIQRHIAIYLLYDPSILQLGPSLLTPVLIIMKFLLYM